MHQQVLFICSGNYYRSRFAELYFNHLAEQQNLAWRAISRGFNPGSQNVGEISRFALAGLVARGIHHTQPRFPQKLELLDLQSSQVIIALKESEHRKLMKAQFSDWEDRTEFWHIHDLDMAMPEEALPELEKAIQNLLLHLSDKPNT
ncbi:MAG: low molecular weight phosphatase family protein [Microscillaceae bacterium]|jgi:protein-tyrosine phosphatase|nr:low molecular weight phosphatase family protein [Microscillaceae bacterium]